MTDAPARDIGGVSLEASLRALTEAARSDAARGWRMAQDAGEARDAVVAARIAAVMLGAALGALDDYEAVVRSRVTEPVPAPPGDPETDYRRWLGMAMGRLETAQCILDEAALDGERLASLWILSREVTRLAYTTVQDLVVHTSGAFADTERLTRTVATMVMLWGQPSGVLDDQVSRAVARERLAL